VLDDRQWVLGVGQFYAAAAGTGGGSRGCEGGWRRGIGRVRAGVVCQIVKDQGGRLLTGIWGAEGRVRAWRARVGGQGPGAGVLFGWLVSRLWRGFCRLLGLRLWLRLGLRLPLLA